MLFLNTFCLTVALASSPDARLHIDAVKKILWENPELIVPHLDTPNSSIPMAGTGSLEMMPVNNHGGAAPIARSRLVFHGVSVDSPNNC
jgi:hypothetical protein